MKLKDLNEAVMESNVDASARGVFIGAKVSDDSRKQLADVIELLDISNPTDIAELHCTIMYSYDNPPDALFNEYDDLKLIYDNEVEATVVGVEIFPTQSGKNALVMRIASGYLSDRHEYIKDIHGLSYTYDEYKPHITLSYDAGDVNIDDIDIKKYIKRVNFSEEYVSELDPTWG